MRYLLAFATTAILISGAAYAKSTRKPSATEPMGELRSEKLDLQYLPETKESSQVITCRYGGVDESVAAKCVVGKVTMSLGLESIDSLLRERRYVQNFADFVRDRDLARQDTTIHDIKNRFLNELEYGLRRVCLEKFEKDTGIRPDASFVKVFTPGRVEKSDQSTKEISVDCAQEPVTLFGRTAAQ